MGETTGFIQWARETPVRRPVPVRLRDWREVYASSLLGQMLRLQKLPNASSTTELALCL